MTPLQQFLANGNVLEEINFTSHDHRYFDPLRPEIKYTSATTIIGQYEEPYDSDLWSMQTALKEKGYKVRVDKKDKVLFVNGLRHSLHQLKQNTLFKSWQDLVLAKWKVGNEEACERGNRTHDYLENTINISKGYQPHQGSDNYNITPSRIKGTISSTNDLNLTNLSEVYPAVYDRLNSFINRGCTIFAEKRVRLDLVQLAGMIDVPIFKNNSLEFAILDWKTNKDELKTKPGYYKKEWIGGQLIKTDVFVETNDTLIGSLNHVPDCKFNKYALQLSLYAYILECWGYKLVPNGLEIIHFRPNKEPKLVKIPYMINEIELIMKDRLRELNVEYEIDVEVTSSFKRGILK
jgi:hypothetical protein